MYLTLLVPGGRARCGELRGGQLVLLQRLGVLDVHHGRVLHHRVAAVVLCAREFHRCGRAEWNARASKVARVTKG